MAGDQVLQHGLASTERAGNAAGATTGNGQKGVDDPLGGDHRLLGIEPLAIAVLQQELRQGPPYWPVLRQGEGAAVAAGVGDPGHHRVHRERTLLDPVQGDRPGLVEGHHDLVGEAPLLHRADHITGPQGFAHPGRGLKRPGLLGIERGHRGTAGQEGAVAGGQASQGILQTVIHLGEQPRAQLHREQLARLLHGIPDPHPPGALEHLGIGGAAMHPQHLGLEPLLSLPFPVLRKDVEHLVLEDRPGRRGRHSNGHQVVLNSDHAGGVEGVVHQEAAGISVTGPRPAETSWRKRAVAAWASKLHQRSTRLQRAR